MPPPEVFIIILQYNNSQDTIRCLNSVKELDYPDYEVLIVDNSSQSKHLENLRAFQMPNLKLLTADSNLGYSGGNNLGIKRALKEGADYIFILNPDTIIEGGLLRKLVECAKSEPQIGIVGPVVKEGDKMTASGRIKWFRTEFFHQAAPISDAKCLPLNAGNYIPGSSMLIKRKVIENIGLLDERFFLYFEDADYCVRARKFGYKLALAPAALTAHAVSASTSRLGSALLLRYHFRNAHLFNWENGPFWVKLGLPLWSLFIIIKQLLKIIFAPAKRDVSKAILAGVGDFYKRRFGKIDV